MLGAGAELHSLQLFDDALETLNLGVAMIDCSSNVAHQALQKLRIGGEIGEIEQHVRWYSNTLIRRRIATQFQHRILRITRKSQAFKHALARANRFPRCIAS
ncbi:MAG: hypothetical protein WA418_30080 [Bradyrhizobium sp.]